MMSSYSHLRVCFVLFRVHFLCVPLSSILKVQQSRHDKARHGRVDTRGHGAISVCFEFFCFGFSVSVCSLHMSTCLCLMSVIPFTPIFKSCAKNKRMRQLAICILENYHYAHFSHEHDNGHWACICLLRRLSPHQLDI